ncbi:unnamed protein product [Caenorhabditis sp. 36 PRJEB53466]|nr:unnamed protein product [Caenorhabditis sp. 36 PRJEB53466]
MDQTYAEIENTYAEIATTSAISTTPRRRDESQKHRHLRRDFGSRLPIEYRYPKRNSMTSSSATKKWSLASKSSSSGYSSSSSVSSITTIINGAKPYRPKREESSAEEAEGTSMMNKVIGEDSGGEEESEETERTPKSRACCIECREKEIRDEFELESHQYANLKSIRRPQDPYVFLMVSMLTSLQKEEGGRRVAKVQQRLEKVLRLKPRDPFNVEHKPTFDRQVASFSSEVTIRLRAVSDVAPDTYRDVSAKFCEALHHGSPNTKGLKSILKGMKNLLNF